MPDRGIRRCADSALEVLSAAAAHRPAGTDMGTALVLCGIMVADDAARWSRWELTAGPLDWTATAAAPDPGRGAGATWSGVPISLELALAFELLDDLCAAYGLAAADPGLLALAVIAVPGSAALRISRRRGASRGALLALVQADVLGSELDGLDGWLDRWLDHRSEVTVTVRDESPLHAPDGAPGAADPIRRAARRRPSAVADDLDLLAVLLEDRQTAPLLRHLGLGSDIVPTVEVHCRSLGTRPVDKIAPEGPPGPLGLLRALARHPSTGLRRMLRTAGLEPVDLALAAVNTGPALSGSARTAGALLRPAKAALVLSRLVASAVLVVQAVALGRSWEVALIPLLWVGFPRLGGWWGAAAGLLVTLAGRTDAWLVRSTLACLLLDPLVSAQVVRSLQSLVGMPVSAAAARRESRRGPAARSHGRVGTTPWSSVLSRIGGSVLGREVRRRDAVSVSARLQADRRGRQLSGPGAAAVVARPPVASGPPLRPPAEILLGLARRRTAWRACSAVCVVLLLGAVTSSPSWLLLQPRRLGPPYPRPAVAAVLPSAAELAAAVGRPLVPVREGPPTDRLHTSRGGLAADLVATQEVGAWDQEWQSVDQATLIDIRAKELTGREAATAAQVYLPCEGTRPILVSHADTAGLSGAGDSTYGCARVLRGRTVVGVEVADLVDSARAEKVLRQVAAATFPGVPVSSGPGPVTGVLSRTAMALRLTSYGTLLLGALLLALPMTTRRAFWRRLLSARRDRPGAAPTGVVPVDLLARYALIRHRAINLTRLAGSVVVLRISEQAALSLRTTAALVVGWVAVVTAAERSLRARSSRTVPPGASVAVRCGIACGLLLTVAVLIGAGWFALVGVGVLAAGTSPSGPDYLATRFGQAALVGALAVVVAARLPLAFARRMAMREQQWRARNDQDEAVLLLRSFADDRQTLWTRRRDRSGFVDQLCLRRRERFEIVLVSILHRFGVVEAVSEPGSRLPPIGATRRELTDETWLPEVRVLIRGSRVVCLVLGRTEGVMKEIREVVALGALDRTVFVLPPVSRDEAALRLRLLGRELGLPWDQFAVVDPVRVLAVVCPEPGAPLMLTSVAQDDVGYDAAMEAALAVLSPGPSSSPEASALLADARFREGPPPVGRRYPDPGEQQQEPVRRPSPGARVGRMAWALAFLLALTASYVFGRGYGSSTVRLRTGLAVNAIVQDQSSEAVYGLFGGGQVARLDLAGRTVGAPVRISHYVDDLVVRGGTAYVTSRQRGVVEAVDLGTGAVRWTAAPAGAVRGLALNGTRLLVLAPGRHAVVELDATTGRPIRRVDVGGVPWDLAVAGSMLWVAIEDRGQVVRLRLDDLARLGATPVAPHPQRVLPAGSSVWVYSPLAHRVALVGSAAGRPLSIGTADQKALLASDGRIMAVSGLEAVSTVTETGRLSRHRYLVTSVSAVCLTRGGDVLVGSDGRVDRLT